MSTEHVGIVGSGDVGKALAKGFASRDWAVTIGTRSPEKLEDWLGETTGDISIGTFDETADFGDVLVLAVRGDVAEDAMELADPAKFSGKLVLDATNPLDFSGDGPPDLFVGGTDSLGEQIQDRLPEATVVKCFNTVSNVQMVDPAFETETPPMMICGNDSDAKAQAEAILVSFGWPEALDVGDITSSRYLEALVPLWVRIGAIYDTWEHAFAVAR